jgi:tousled-like kinase
MQRRETISELLISTSKAEREETRLKLRQDSLRLGGIVLIRYRGSIVTNTFYFLFYNIFMQFFFYEF